MTAIMADRFRWAPEDIDLQTQKFRRGSGDLHKVGPEGYIHGWIKVGSGNTGPDVPDIKPKDKNYWADRLSNEFSGEGIYSLPASKGSRKAISDQLDKQGLPPDHPLRGVLVSRASGTHKLIHRDADGNIDAGINYGVDKQYKDIKIDDVRVIPQRQGIGTKMLIDLARRHPRYSMTVYGAVAPAKPWYARTGAQFSDQVENSVGYWDKDAMAALRSGQPAAKILPDVQKIAGVAVFDDGWDTISKNWQTAWEHELRGPHGEWVASDIAATAASKFDELDAPQDGQALRRRLKAATDEELQATIKDGQDRKVAHPDQNPYDFDRTIGNARGELNRRAKKAQPKPPKNPKLPKQPRLVTTQVDLTGVDPKLQLPVTNRINRFKNRYPYAAGHLQKVSMAPPGVLADNAMADVVYRGNGMSEMRLSPKYFSDFKVLAHSAYGAYQSRFHPVDSMMSVIDHELGHVIDNTTWQGILLSSDKMWTYDATHISKYARTNSREAFAEAFSAWEAVTDDSTDPAGYHLTDEMKTRLSQLQQLDANHYIQKSAGIPGPYEPTCIGYVPEDLIPSSEDGKLASPDLAKVGPEGYIHGYICVRPPCGNPGDEVYHPDHGYGRITGTDFATIPDASRKRGTRSDRLMTAEFDDGTKTMLNGEVQPAVHGSVAPVAADPPDWMEKTWDRYFQLDDEMEKERIPGSGGLTQRGKELHEEQGHLINGNPWVPDDDPQRHGLTDRAWESGITEGMQYRAMLMASGRRNRAHLGTENGLTPDATDQKIVSELKTMLANRRVATRVTNTNLARILDSGRFETQFETNRSKGLKSNDIRAALESAQFGYPETLEPSLRPVYAYMDEGYDRPAGTGTKFLGDFGTDDLSMFGTTQVVFKDSVKNRTTFNVGDSMDNKYATLPSRLTDPRPDSYASFGTGDGGMANPAVLHGMDRDYNGSKFRRQSFIEAQVHSPDGKQRPLTTDDIDHVIFPSTPPASIRDQLTRENIPWTVSNARVIAKTGTQDEKNRAISMYRQDLASVDDRLEWIRKTDAEYQEKYGRGWTGTEDIPKIQKIADSIQSSINILQGAGAT